MNKQKASCVSQKKHVKGDFYHGIIAALAVVALHDQQVVFDEIVRTVDEAKLISVARRNGDMRWSGLSQYGYGRKREDAL